MKYTVIDIPHPSSDLHPIQIDEGEFAGCQVIYGHVAFDENESGEAILKFDYDIVNGYTVSKDRMEAFVQTIGEVLTSIIEEFLNKEEVVYKGGA